MLAYPVAICEILYFRCCDESHFYSLYVQRINVYWAPRKRVDTMSAFVCICDWVSVCPTVMTCSFQCPKLCGDCMPYIKTKESTGSFFFFFFYINIDLWSTQWKVNSLNYILLWSKNPGVSFLKLSSSSRGMLKLVIPDVEPDNKQTNVKNRKCRVVISYKEENN